MLGVKRMPRPLSESRKPESRRKTAVLRGMRLRPIDSPPGFPGQPCAMRERAGVSGEPLKQKFRDVEALTHAARVRVVDRSWPAAAQRLRFVRQEPIYRCVRGEGILGVT